MSFSPDIVPVCHVQLLTAHYLGMDLAMLMIGGKERSEKELSGLLDWVGLKLVKIWKGKVGSQTVIECRLK
jgi:hypothetical protein